MNPTCTNDTLVSLLVTLYAIAPSIIITVMYSFLSTIEGDLINLTPIVNSENDLNKRLIDINKFVLFSSKIFHLSMAYYLTLLMGALSAKCLSTTSIQDLVTKYLVCYSLPSIVMVFCSIIYFAYFGRYFSKDILASFKEINHYNEQNHSSKRNIIVMIYRYIASQIRVYREIYIIFLCYGIFPIILPFALRIFSKMRNDEAQINLWWITLTIFHLWFWWLVMPYKYKPLTNLAYLKKKQKSA